MSTTRYTSWEVKALTSVSFLDERKRSTTVLNTKTGAKHFLSSQETKGGKEDVQFYTRSHTYSVVLNKTTDAESVNERKKVEHLFVPRII